MSHGLFWSAMPGELQTVYANAEAGDIVAVVTHVSNYEASPPAAQAVENYVWPDFTVGAEGSWVVFRRDREKYFPRKKKAEPDQVNGKDQDQEIIPETMTV